MKERICLPITKKDTVIPSIFTIYASAGHSMSTNSVYTDINNMTITFTMPVNGSILCKYTHRLKIDSATDWAHRYLRFVLDATNGDDWKETIDTGLSTTVYFLRDFHAVFENVRPGEHTLKVQHGCTNVNVTIGARRLSLFLGQ